MPEWFGVVGWLTELEQSVRLPSRSSAIEAYRLPTGRVKPPKGGLSFLASVTASQTILMMAALSLALRLEALAEALRVSTVRQ